MKSIEHTCADLPAGGVSIVSSSKTGPPLAEFQHMDYTEWDSVIQ